MNIHISNDATELLKVNLVFILLKNQKCHKFHIFFQLTLSYIMMVLSTICWSWVSLRLVPTIIFRTWNSSPLEMNPSLSMS